MKFTFCAKVIKAKETFLLFRICCQCKYGVKAIFNVFALLVIVVQTQSLTYVQVRSKQFKDSICYTCKSIISHSKFNNLTRLCCNRKVVANVQLFFTFAMVCEHWVNAVFTIFALRANIMQLKKLHLSKYEQSLSNVVFTFHLLRFCYGCKSVFSCSASSFRNWQLAPLGTVITSTYPWNVFREYHINRPLAGVDHVTDFPIETPCWLTSYSP